MKQLIFKTKKTLLFPFVLIIVCCGCNDRYGYPIPESSFEEIELSPPVNVTMTDESGHWKMFVDGEEFYVKGVAINNFPETAGHYGANTIRTYGVNDTTRAILDRAYEAGLYVNFGLWVNRETDGFNYDDEAAVAQHLAAIKEDIDRFKDHPALLCWSIGNEADASYTNNKLWTFVNDVAQYIHEVDPNHPTTTTLVNSEVNKVRLIAEMAPEIDFLSINSYAPNVPSVLGNLTAAEWEKPYMITEFGPRGTWQMSPEPARVLDWEGLVEQTSTEKAADYLQVYQNHIYPHRDNGCIGSFVFLWGYQLHGEVLTWFALHDKKGYTFPAVDAMQYAWTGSYPDNRAPVIADRDAILMNGRKAEDNIKVDKETENMAFVVATDPDDDPLSYDWMIMREGTASSDGSLPDGISGLIVDNTLPEISFKAPAETGGYRLIVFVRDNANKKVASGVIPFYVN